MAQFVRICTTSDLPDPGKAVFEIDEQFVLLCHVGGKFYALSDRCTHDDGPLGDGPLDGYCIACPRHGAKFDIRDGRVMSMPATQPTSAYEVKVEGGDVFVRLGE